MLRAGYSRRRVKSGPALTRLDWLTRRCTLFTFLIVPCPEACMPSMARGRVRMSATMLSPTCTLLAAVASVIVPPVTTWVGSTEPSARMSTVRPSRW